MRSLDADVDKLCGAIAPLMFVSKEEFIEDVAFEGDECVWWRDDRDLGAEEKLMFDLLRADARRLDEYTRSFLGDPDVRVIYIGSFRRLVELGYVVIDPESGESRLNDMAGLENLAARWLAMGKPARVPF